MTQLDELDQLERELGPALRATFGACIPDRPAERVVAARLPFAPTHTTDAVAGDQRRRHSVLVGAAAAAAVVIGVAGLAVVAGRADEPNAPTSPAPSPVSVTPPVDGAVVDTSTPVSDPVADTDPTDPADPMEAAEPDIAADDLGIALATFAPDGYVLDDVSVTRAWSPFAGRIMPEYTQYVRRVDGAIEATVTLTSQPLNDEFDTAKGSISVHGRPAQIWDSGEGIRVTWSEHDRILAVSTNGVSWDATAALAEQTTVDPSTGSVALQSDAGFELVELPPAPPADAAATTISYRAAGTAGDLINIARWPNSGQQTLELGAFHLAQQGWTVEPAVIHDLPAIIATPPNQTTPLVVVQWVDGDGVWNVTGRQAPATLLAIANGLERATLEEARQLRRELDAGLAALPELDRAVLPNGIEVSVRSIGNGAGAVCIHQPVQLCERIVSEGSLMGEHQSAFTRTIWIDDVPWLIGWAEGEHQPAVYDEGGSGDPVADVVHDAIVAADSGGTFIALPSPTDDLNFSFDPDTFPVFGTSIPGDTNPELLR